MIPIPSFPHLTTFKSYVSFRSMNDVDVLLQIIEQSEITLKEVHFYCHDPAIHALADILIQCKEDDSLDYYSLNLALVTFECDLANAHPGSGRELFEILAERSNIVSYVKVVKSALPTIVAILGSFSAVETMEIIEMGGEMAWIGRGMWASRSIVTDQMDGIELWLKTNKPPLFSSMRLRCPYGSEITSSMLNHPLKQLCHDLGIQLDQA
jgi:hypothetical protein